MEMNWTWETNEGTESRQLAAIGMQAQITRQIMKPMKGIRNSFLLKPAERKQLRKDARESSFAWPGGRAAGSESRNS